MGSCVRSSIDWWSTFPNSGRPRKKIDTKRIIELRAKGDYAGAEPLYRRALAIQEMTLGPDHPETQQTRHNLESLGHKDSAQKPNE